MARGSEHGAHFQLRAHPSEVAQVQKHQVQIPLEVSSSEPPCLSVATAQSNFKMESGACTFPSCAASTAEPGLGIWRTHRRPLPPPRLSGVSCVCLLSVLHLFCLLSVCPPVDDVGSESRAFPGAPVPPSGQGLHTGVRETQSSGRARTWECCMLLTASACRLGSGRTYQCFYAKFLFVPIISLVLLPEAQLV